MTHLEVDLSGSAMVAFIRALRSIDVDAMAAANPGESGPAMTARPSESVLASFHTPILRRLLERAIGAMEADPDADRAERGELSALLALLQERRDVAVCVLLVPPDE